MKFSTTVRNFLGENQLQFAPLLSFCISRGKTTGLTRLTPFLSFFLPPSSFPVLRKGRRGQKEEEKTDPVLSGRGGEGGKEPSAYTGKERYCITGWILFPGSSEIKVRFFCTAHFRRDKILGNVGFSDQKSTSFQVFGCSNKRPETRTN